MEEFKRQLGYKSGNMPAQQLLKSKDARRLKEQQQSLTFTTEEETNTKAK